MAFTEEFRGSIGRMFLSFGISTELWYNTLHDKSKRTHLVSLGWYDSSDHSCRLYALTIGGLTLKIGWLK